MLFLDIQPYIFTIGIIVIVSMIIMICLTLLNQTFDKKQKVRFLLLFLAVAALSCMDLATNIMDAVKINELLPLNYICNFIGFALSPAVALLISRALYKGKEPLLVSILYGAYIVVLAFLVGFKKLFELKPDTFEYIRHPAYFFFFVPVMVISFTYLLVNSILLVIKQFMKGHIVLFSMYALLIAGLCVQIIKASVHVNILVMGVVSIIYYEYISSMWAQQDGLTGLMSHYAFLQAVKNIKPNTIVLVMDADDFKDINDKFGHVEGDKCLVLIAKEIKFVFGKFGSCYRLGGDEFAVIVNTKKDFDINKRIELFKNRIAMQKQRNLCPNISVGYAVFEKDKLREELIEVADKNMYINKAIQKAKNEQKSLKTSEEDNKIKTN